MKNLNLIGSIILLFIAGACTHQNETADKLNNPEAIKDAIVKANDELLNKGNLDFADQVFAKEYRGAGPDVIKNMVTNMRGAFPDLQVTIEPIIVDGKRTAWLRTHTGTHQGEFAGYAPTGMKVTWETMVITEYNEDGMVAKEWGVSNIIEVLQRQRVEEVAIE
ncbi:MAG: hypothetical protein CMO01_18590 [Thalassobius sp.]|nr:hypothetical protein [Thalassovita sp.]